jgi:GNAT superfamily N-acetyltransferase
LDDLDRLETLMLALQDHLEGCNPSLWRMTPQSRARLRAQVASRLEAPNARALVADHSHDGVVGAIFGRVTTNTRYTPSMAGSIDQLYVVPDHRRTGVGTALVSALCAFFAGAGVNHLSLRYAVDNAEASAFWEALSFKPRILTVGALRQDVQTLADSMGALRP